MAEILVFQFFKGESFCSIIGFRNTIRDFSSAIRLSADILIVFSKRIRIKILLEYIFYAVFCV